MNLFRPLRAAALFSLASAGLSSCLAAPEYPIEPSIDFTDLRVARTPAGAGGVLATNEITFVLNFKDGDGDLGLSDDDIKQAPYNIATGGVSGHGNSFNFLLQPYIYTNGQWVLFTTPLPPGGFGFPGEYDGRFLRLDEVNTKPAPLKGELRYRFPITLDGTIYKAGQRFKFDIVIVDRGLHKSNKVTSSEVTL